MDYARGQLTDPFINNKPIVLHSKDRKGTKQPTNRLLMENYSKTTKQLTKPFMTREGTTSCSFLVLKHFFYFQLTSIFIIIKLKFIITERFL